jgi:CubicO group peptidase (beta-lactamase class C family)
MLTGFGAAGMSTSMAHGAPNAQPENLGFCRQRLNHLDELRNAQVAKGEMSGIVTLIARHGKVAHFSALGYADLGSKKKMAPDTIFRLYSMTKPIVATALMMLYEEGKFQLTDPICEYIPEFSGLRVLRAPEAPIADTVPVIRDPTIHDLLRHTAGFARGLGGREDAPANRAVDAAYLAADLFSLDTSLAEMMTKLARIPLRHQPGTTWDYSVSADIQARLVEVLSGMSFDEFLQRRLFGPLAMKDSGYCVNDPSRLAAVHWLKQGKLVPSDEVHGYPAPTNYLLEPANINSYTKSNPHKGGSNGLVATATDYWRFAQMILNGGELDGQRILSRNTVNYMARDHLGAIRICNPDGAPSGMGFGLGFAVLKDPVSMGIHGSEGQFFWFGASHALFWIDPTEGIVVVALAQHLSLPPRAIHVFHSQIRAMVYGALVHQ